MKAVRFLGDSLKRLREFPDHVRQDTGYQLDKLQRGELPSDFKPIAAIGKGVEELRIWDEAGTFRVVYMARWKSEVVVLHAFQKKSKATSKSDIALARKRLTMLLAE